jgi:hypothetical protein
MVSNKPPAFSPPDITPTKAKPECAGKKLKVRSGSHEALR